MAAYQVVKSHQVERFGDAIDPMSRKTSALLRHFCNKQLKDLKKNSGLLRIHELHKSAQKYLSV